MPIYDGRRRSHQGCSDLLAKALAAMPAMTMVSLIYDPMGLCLCDASGLLPNIRQFHQEKVVFLGMNPGPYGMVQSGIPFGEIAAVTEWLQLASTDSQTDERTPKATHHGLIVPRSEVSGRRLWGLFAERFTSAEDFFADHFILNYCPLAFLAETGRNITSTSSAAQTRAFMAQHCDQHFKKALNALQPDWCIGVGGYAEACLQRNAP